MAAVDRRHFLRTSASAAVSAGVVATMAMPSDAAAPDPMLALVCEFQRQYDIAENSDASQRMSHVRGPELRAAFDEYDQIAAQTWKPIRDRLEAGTDLPPVTTMEGAARCMAFVFSWWEGSELDDAARNILIAAQVFLDGRASA